MPLAINQKPTEDRQNKIKVYAEFLCQLNDLHFNSFPLLKYQQHSKYLLILWIKMIVIVDRFNGN